MSATMSRAPEQLLRQLFPELMQKLNKEQLAEFGELVEMYASTRDPEVLETAVEMLIPESVGPIAVDAEVSESGAKQLDQFQLAIGQQIKKLRVQRGMTQEELAIKADIKQSHVSRLEVGVHTPSDLTIVRIAKALGVEPSQIDPGL